MSEVIIVRIAEGYQPEHGTPFDAVVSALNHFEIRSIVSKAEGDELVEALRNLLECVERTVVPHSGYEQDAARAVLATLEGR